MNLTLLTDPYELTMAYGYWKLGMADQEAVFHHFYRTPPFEGEFAIACGLQSLIEAIEDFHYTDSDLAYLATLKDAEGNPLFEESFFDYLSELKITCDVDAIPEGRAVFPQEPLVRVKGPILQAQLLETVLLNLINFQTLIATKASRVRLAAGDDIVMEFGLRRAHGPNGGLLASRASYIGGCDAVSNVLAGKTYGIPVMGTNAHSWVMAFPSEMEAFEKWAEVMPGNCVLLIDTYNTEQGIENAIEIAKKHKVLAVRLDSGDLLSLSKMCREKLDQAGLHDVKIVASNNLDEKAIGELKMGGAPIDIWGIGTRLTTGYPRGALGGVYKLAAVRDEKWRYVSKTSDEPHKATLPGVLQVKRTPTGDHIYNAIDGTDVKGEDLLVPVFRGGTCVYQSPTIQESRAVALKERFSEHYSVEVS